MMEHIFKRLETFRRLEPGWDSYKGRKIDARAIRAAREFLEGVQVVPTSAGGVQVEVHHAGVNLEIEFERSGKVRSMACDSGGTE